MDFSSFWSDGIALCRNEYINPSKSLAEWRSAGPNPQEFKCIKNFFAFWREVRIFSFVRVVFESKTIEISLKISQNFSLTNIIITYDSYDMNYYYEAIIFYLSFDKAKSEEMNSQSES